MYVYVVLNFEGRYQDPGRGAADSTVLAFKKRYEDLKQKKGLAKLFPAKNTVIEHRCVEKQQGIVGFHDRQPAHCSDSCRLSEG
jgi:hypothetical protein